MKKLVELVEYLINSTRSNLICYYPLSLPLPPPPPPPCNGCWSSLGTALLQYYLAQSTLAAQWEGYISFAYTFTLAASKVASSCLYD
jgi:hypothetical protein